MRVTVDASVFGLIVLRQALTPELERLADTIKIFDLVQPAHWPIEIAGLFVRGARARDITPDRRARLRDQMRRLVDGAEVDAKLPSTAIFDAAVRLHISVYDAAYLELAVRKGTPIMTADGALANVLSRAGVERLPLP